MPPGRRGYWENRWKGLDTILVDRLKVSKTVDVSYAMVTNMLNKNESIMREVSTRWIPRLLTVDKGRRDGCQCRSSVWTSSSKIRNFFVESSMKPEYDDTSETKPPSKQYIFRRTYSEEGKGRLPSTGKIMATHFSNEYFKEREDDYGTVRQWIIGPI